MENAKDPLLASLRAAVSSAPDDVPLRLHLAELLIWRGMGDEAVVQLAAALALAPKDPSARALMARAVAPPDPPAPAGATELGADGKATPASTSDPTIGFDWSKAEDEVGHLDVSKLLPPLTEDVAAEATTSASPWDVAATDVRLADVGGMAEVKARLEAAFLAPMRNTELAALYRKSLRGGLMLYGPPGCGKTFIARAVAGELGASFLSVSLADVLDMYLGQSERNLRDLFEAARRAAPCVLFLDEIDALGQKRSQVRHSGARGTVNQLLAELDGVSSSNDGVFILAATNHPWDVDSALRRPGRLDRTLLVLPPDREARESILRYHVRDRPVANVIAQDGLPRLPVRREHQQGPVQAARPAQGAVDVPRVVRGGEDEDAVVRRAHAVELGEQLVDGAARSAVSDLRALLSQRVDLVEEQDAGRCPPGRLEQVPQVAFGLSQVHVEHVCQRDRQEAGAQLTGDGSRDEGLAAAGRAVQHQPATQALAV